MQKNKDSNLRLLAEVGREFEAGNIASVITHYDDRIDGIKLDVSQLGLLSGHHRLLADRLVFVDVEVKNVNLKNNPYCHFSFKQLWPFD